MDSPSSITGGRRRLPTTHYAEDQAFDQIAKEVRHIITLETIYNDTDKTSSNCCFILYKYFTI